MQKSLHCILQFNSSQLFDESTDQSSVSLNSSSRVYEFAASDVKPSMKTKQINQMPSTIYVSIAQ